MTEYIFIFGMLFTGFYLLFRRIRWLEIFSAAMKRTEREMSESARRRLLSDRRKLLLLQSDNTIWYRLERELYYCGFKRSMPYLTVELWLVFNVIMLAVAFLLFLFLFGNPLMAVAGTLPFMLAEYLIMRICRARETRSVKENLLKLLNFLGNYSITAGEVTGIFNQISKYMDEPIRSALNECCYEAQTTGDAGMALLVMAEKIEHPKFKELAYNMEVSIRYCADFKALVDGSRRSLREYLRMGEERKGILREAVINMTMLLAMSVFALLTVDGLIEQSIWGILFGTLPGYIALLIVGTIFCLMLRQLLKLSQ